MPQRIFLRGKTNRLSPAVKAGLADSLCLTHVVALCPTRDDDWAGVSGVTYLHRPMPDGPRVPAWLPDLADALRGAVVLTYCNAGRNRSALLAALLYRLITGCSGQRAVAHLRAVRPNALANPAFVSYLEGLA